MDLEALERSAKFIKFLLIKKKLHGEFIKIGLLCDLDLDTKEDVDFVRLSLARAMAYCTDKEKGRHVSMENGPIGQLSAVVFKKNNALECISCEDMQEEEQKTDTETETEENTVQSMSSEDMQEEEQETETETGENTVQSMSSEDMHEDKKETETETETGENTVQSMSSEDISLMIVLAVTYESNS